MYRPQQLKHAPPHHHHQQVNQFHPQAALAHPQMHDAFAEQMMHLDHGKGLLSLSDEDDPSLNTEDGDDGHNEGDKGKKGSLWQRVKWTDAMVRLLVTTVTYTEEVPPECFVGRSLCRDLAALVCSYGAGSCVGSPTGASHHGVQTASRGSD